MSVHLITGYAGKEHITSDDQASFNASVFGSGNYVFNKGNKLRASAKSNTAIDIYDGDVLIHGRHVTVTDVNTVIFDDGTLEMNRVDLIVIEYCKDAVTGIESAILKVIKGEESSGEPLRPNYNEENGIKLYSVEYRGFYMRDIKPLFTLTMSNYDFMMNMQYALHTEKIILPSHSGSDDASCWELQSDGYYVQHYDKMLDFTVFFDINAPMFFLSPEYRETEKIVMESYFDFIDRLLVAKTDTGLRYTFYSKIAIPKDINIWVKGAV